MYFLEEDSPDSLKVHCASALHMQMRCVKIRVASDVEALPVLAPGFVPRAGVSVFVCTVAYIIYIYVYTRMCMHRCVDVYVVCFGIHIASLGHEVRGSVFDLW